MTIQNKEKYNADVGGASFIGMGNKNLSKKNPKE
jgi:hypothetical protein